MLALVVAASLSSLLKTAIKIKLKGNSVDALIDTGSSDSFICRKLVNKPNLNIGQTKKTDNYISNDTRIIS